MSLQRLLHVTESFSTWVGKAASWLVVALMLLVVVEVVKRYAFNMPTAWVFDGSNMLYGTLFMMCGAYALAHDGHVRGDFLYGRFKPRTQAALDLTLYIVFFIPGICALVWSGWTYFGDALQIRETTMNANALPIYPFKFIIPLAGALVLLQGLSEIARCVLCLRTGQWADRLKDAEEIDVIEQQLAASQYVDDQARREAIEKAKNIDDDARQRIGST